MPTFFIKWLVIAHIIIIVEDRKDNINYLTSSNIFFCSEELKKLQDQLNTSRETLLEVCDDGEDLDQSVESLQQSINNLQRWGLLDDNIKIVR